MRKIKTFKQVNIGDQAWENPDAGNVWDKKEGNIIYKGSTEELASSIWGKMYYDMLRDCGLSGDEIDDDYQWVVVQTEDEGRILYNYYCDPSGVVVYDDFQIISKLMSFGLTEEESIKLLLLIGKLDIPQEDIETVSDEVMMDGNIVPGDLSVYESIVFLSTAYGIQIK